MPAPAIVARRSIRHAMDRGLTHGQAAWRIIRVIRATRRWVAADCPELAGWLDEIEAACWRDHARARTARNEQTGD